MMDETTNVSLHAEGGHFGTQLEPPSTFEAEDYQRAAGVALGEGQNGMGTPLVNGDGTVGSTVGSIVGSIVGTIASR